MKLIIFGIAIIALLTVFIIRSTQKSEESFYSNYSTAVKQGPDTLGGIQQ